MRKGQQVVRIIAGPGSARSASLAVVDSVKKGVVRLVGDDSLKYDHATGDEIEPAFPMMYSYIVMMDGSDG